MKQFDELGLFLCKAQGQLFKDSIIEFKGSSNIFIKRFMNSKECLYIDAYNEIDIAKLIYELNLKYNLDKGNIKFNADALYWIGYVYRYWTYTYEIFSNEAYKIATGNYMNKLYEPYHTLDPAVVIQRIYESKGLTNEVDMLEIMKKCYKL